MDIEFKILSKAGDEIEIVTEVPESLRHLKLPAAETILAKGTMGNMLFHHFRGDGFDIWYSNYLMSHTTEIIGRGDIPVLELHIPILNQFESNWEGIEDANLKENQFELSFTPHVNNTASFTGGKQYHTFDIHFTADYLQEFVSQNSELGRFLEKVEKGDPANLMGVTQFLSPDMIRLINSMLKFGFRDTMAPYFYEGAVLQLLVMVLERTAGFDQNTVKTYTPYEIEQTTQAKQLMLLDLSAKYTIKELAKKVALNQSKLQQCFRYLFDTTMYQYILAVKMDYAKQLLLNTTFIEQEIAELVGYPDASNFSAAFKKHFGFSPDYCRKHS